MTVEGAAKVTVPEVEPFSISPAVNSRESNSTSEVVPIFWGKERTISPVDADAIT